MPHVELRLFRRLMVLAISLPVLLLAVLAALLFWEVNALLKADEHAARSSAILAELVRARLLFIDRETGVRGFLLTGERSFLEPYLQAGEQLPGVLKVLEQDLEAIADQRARLGELRQRWRAWEEVAERELALYPAGDYLSVELSGQGKARMDAIRGLLDSIEDVERQQAEARRQNAESQARLVLWSGAGWLIGVGALLSWFSRRQLLSLATQYEISLRQLADKAEALRASEARLEQRVAQRTAELTLANQELESFSYSVSHDLRAPLRAVDGFSHALLQDEGERISPKGHELLQRLRAAATRMGQLIDDLLHLSRVTRVELKRERVDLSALARQVADEFQRREPERRVRMDIAPGLEAHGDPGLLRAMLENLLGNAWKFTGRNPEARIELFPEHRNGRLWYVVRDNGVGFDMAYASKLFSPFQRMHKAKDFPGTGIGLATVQRIVHRHGGLIEAESAPGVGTTLRFTLEEARP